MKRLMAVACILAVSPFSTGCGLIFGGTRQTVRAMSAPEGASITTGAQTADYKTPASLSLERKNQYTLTFSMPGYTSEKLELQHHVQGGIIVLDILFGLVPVVVDAATGAWYKLSPEMANVTLTKTSADVAGPDKIQVALSFKKTKEGHVMQVESSHPGVNVALATR